MNKMNHIESLLLELEKNGKTMIGQKKSEKKD